MKASGMGRRLQTPARQSGAAVLVAMLVVALAAIAASSFLFRSQVEWRRMENLTQVDQARWILRAAEQWGASVLQDDALHSSVDYPGEAWATRLPPVEAEGYRLSGGIEDEDGRFNLNNLVAGGKVDEEQLAIFVRLLQALRLPVTLAPPVVDWIDADNVPLNQDGAEADYYAKLTPAYWPANHPLVSRDELLRVKGFDRQILDRLSPFITVLPTRTGINVNTAPPEVLAALVPGLDVDTAYSIVAKREQSYYRNTQDFQQVLPEGLGAPTDMVTVSSQYFLVQARVRRDRLAIGNQALYRRQGPMAPKLIWRADL
jgi:general secretion pathway protein K